MCRVVLVPIRVGGEAFLPANLRSEFIISSTGLSGVGVVAPDMSEKNPWSPAVVVAASDGLENSRVLSGIDWSAKPCRREWLLVYCVVDEAEYSMSSVGCLPEVVKTNDGLVFCSCVGVTLGIDVSLPASECMPIVLEMDDELPFWDCVFKFDEFRVGMPIVGSTAAVAETEARLIWACVASGIPAETKAKTETRNFHLSRQFSAPFAPEV